ncbi:MAG: hypothetical protein ACD_41C00087G0002 [uncultured bacterium]|nr:MAG: hypothetical protein ACD_41C00087G0002 [uncultured bacterium]
MSEQRPSATIEQSSRIWQLALTQQLDQLPSNAARLDFVYDKLQYIQMFRDIIQEKLGLGIDEIVTSFRAIDTALPNQQFTEAVVTLLDQSISRIREADPALWERIQRRAFVREGHFTSLDDEDFISYGIGEHGWAHIHVSPGQTLGEQKLPLMTKGLLQLIEQLKLRNDVAGITATSPLVASRTYGQLLTQIGFTLEGEIDSELRAERFRTVPQETPIHSASLPKEKYDDAIRQLETLARPAV